MPACAPPTPCASARIHHRGRHDAQEVVQGCIRDRSVSVTRPAHELKDFRTLVVPAGAVVRASGAG